MRRKPYLWIHDEDIVVRIVHWSWVIIVSLIALGCLVLGSLGIVNGLYGGGLFFIIIGTVLGLACWGAAKDDWTLDEREAI